MIVVFIVLNYASSELQEEIRNISIDYCRCWRQPL